MRRAYFRKANERHNVERIRVNNRIENDYRDVYGGHISKPKKSLLSDLYCKMIQETPS